MWQSWMGWKMPLRKWHILWMVPCLICCFIVTLFHIERKWLLIRNSTIILPLKSKLSAKFQRFNAIDGSIKMLKISWIWKKNQLKWKVVKHFTRASKETIQGPANPPPLDKTLLCLWNKNFLTEIYRNTYYICVQTASRMSFLGVKKWYSANVFLATNRNMFAGKFAKPERRLTSRKFENLMMFTGSCGQI